MSRWLSRLALPGAEFRAVGSMAKRDIAPKSLAIKISESVAMEVPAVEVPAIEVPAATKTNRATKTLVAKMPGAMKPAVAKNRACTDRHGAAVPNNSDPGMTRSLSLR